MILRKPLGAVKRWLWKLSSKNILLLIVSFLIALFAWAYIASSIATDYSKSFSNLPVTIDTAGTKAESLRLSVLDPPESLTVNATIYGNRTDIGGMNKNDLEAYVDFSAVSEATGKQAFPIKIRTASGKALANAPKLSVNTVELTMDRFDTKTVEVREFSHSKITPGDEVTINEEDIVCDPATVSVYGPTSKLKLIDHIRVNIRDEEEISRTKTYTDVTEATLISADNTEISAAAFEMPAISFSVKIPVYYMHELPVTVDISDFPDNFNKEIVLDRLILRADQDYSLPGYGDNNLKITIKTESPEEKEWLDSLPSLSIGSVSLSSLSINMKPLEKTITLKEGDTNLSNFDSVSVLLDDTDLVAEQRWISNSAINLINPSSNFHYEKQSGRTSVTLIGTAEEVAKVRTDELQASVNLYNAAISEEGTKEQAVIITLPDTVSGVWISPMPMVNISATYADSSD